MHCALAPPTGRRVAVKSLSACLAIVIGLASCSTRGGGEAPSAPEPSTAQAAAPQPAGGSRTKRALLVGINKYKYPDVVSPLAGSLNDVEDMKSVLIGKFEFDPANIQTLKDEQATHAGIINALRGLIDKAQKDDIVVFHYSGHGSQMPDVTKKRMGGVDETIVSYDSRDPAGKVFDISGAELHGLLVQLAARTKNITFILDSCHSGTLVRGARVRSAPEDKRTPPPLPDYAVATTRGLGQGNGDKPVQYAFIAATTSKESAFEHNAEGTEHGALTYFLARQLRAVGAGATYRDVMDSVAGHVTANYPSQTPQLEGAEADQFIFGDGSSLSRAYVSVSPLDAGRVTLKAGQVQGVTTDSTYDVYKPGTKKFAPPETPLARVQITSVGPFTSEGKILSAAKVADFSRAVEREHRYANRKIRIFFDGSQGSAHLQAIQAGLKDLPQVEIAGDIFTCHMQVRETDGKIQTLAADSTTLSTPISVSDPQMAARVLEQIRGWAKWFSVLSISNSQPGFEVQLSVKASETRDPFARVGKPDAGVWDGENVDVTIKNASTRELYVSLLDLSSDGSISVVYPSVQGSHEVLPAGQTFSRTFTSFVPKGRSVVTDVLKVFGSSKPIDLNPLVGGPIREIPPTPKGMDPLQDLLDEAGGQRALVPVGTKPASLGEWTTTQRVLVIKRKR
jgi:hypothetical protein